MLTKELLVAKASADRWSTCQLGIVVAFTGLTAPR